MRTARQSRGGLTSFFESQSKPLKARYRLGERREPQVQSRKHESSSNEGETRRYACQEKRPARVAEHRNERKAEKDVAGRKRHVLPAIVADLQE